LRRAHRLLLDRPVLARAQRPEEYRLVARQIEALARWHYDHTGWPIYYDERAGVIRLRRRSSVVPSGAWEPWKSDVNLSSPRDYACLAYLLWYARSPLALGRGGPRQVLLSDLCERLAHRSALGAAEGEGYEPLDFTRRRSDYWSLRRALKALEDLGAVLILDEVSAANSGDPREIGQALIEFTDVVESLIVELSLDRVTSAGEYRSDPFSLTAPVLDEAATPPVRRAWRTLLLGPVLLRRDDPSAHEAIARQHNLIESDGEELFGYALDLAPTYARFIRPSGTSSDRTPPVLNHQQRGVVHAGLLLCAAIRERVVAGELSSPDQDGCLELPFATVKQIFRAVCALHQRRWGNELADANPGTVLNKALDALRTAGLVRGPDARGNVLILPTAARYRAAYEADEAGDVDGAQLEMGMT
jgi:uncharacterized protein (TIGR02678 family)